MEVKINITNDAIDLNTEASAVSSDILLNGKPLSVTTLPHYANFIKKIPCIVQDPKSIDLKRTVNTKGEVVDWVTVFANCTTSEIFDTFKSIGLYFPKLSVGICSATNTMYTSSKLCKDLSKYSESQKSAILMYILSIAEFIMKSNEYLISYEFNGLSGTLSVTDGGNFSKCLRAFTKEETWYLKDAHDDNYQKVYFYNFGIARTSDCYQADGNGMQIGILKSKTGKHAGAVMVRLGASHYTFVITGTKSYTDFDLCAMEVSSDSICSSVAESFNGVLQLEKVSKVPLTSDMKFMEFDGESFSEFVGSEKIPEWLSTWIVKMIAKGARIADADDISHICSKYGVVPFESFSTIVTLSPVEMKESYNADKYAQELYKQIQPYYDTYTLGPELDANLKGFSNGAIYSMAFVGESGTGKSTAARVIPTRVGIPYVSVNLSVNVEESDLFGSMVPNAEKSSAEEPEFVWADGIITKAVRNGYCVVLEELNFARPGVLGKLNSLLDENRQIDLATGEIVHAHPNFRIIATCNIAYEGTNRFNKALINRFDDVTVFRDLTRTEAINVIKQRTGYTSVAKISKVYDVYEALKKFATEQNVNAVVSMRQLLNIFTKGKYYSNAKDAVQRIMINGAFIEDTEYQKVFEDTVLTAFDLKFKI